MQNIIRKIARILSYVYPKKILEYMGVLRRYVYSEKLKRQFSVSGNIVSIRPPMDLKGAKYIAVGEEFRTGPGMILHCWDEYDGEKYSPCLSIGNNANIGRNNHIGCINEIRIGDNLLTGNNVFITDHFHGMSSEKERNIPPINRKLYSKGGVRLGDNIWLGDNVVIMPGVSIGNNVIVGANSVVTKDIEENSVAVGAPAKIIKKI